jgi:hypothetical protein
VLTGSMPENKLSFGKAGMLLPKFPEFFFMMVVNLMMRTHYCLVHSLRAFNSPRQAHETEKSLPSEHLTNASADGPHCLIAYFRIL